MFDAQVVADAWKRALDVWGLVVIAVPLQDPKADALAFIELNTRQVVINPERIAATLCTGGVPAGRNGGRR